MATQSAIALTLFGAGLAVLVAVAAAARFRQAADRGLALAGLMVALVAQMLANVALASGAILRWPVFAQAHVPLAFAIGPLFYLHIRAQTDGRVPRHAWLHLLVAASVLTALLPFYFSDTVTKRAFMTAALGRYPTEWRIRQGLLLAQMGIYVIAAWRALRHADTRADRVLWSRGLAVACLGAWAVAVLRYALAYRASTAPVATAAGTIGLAAVIVGGLVSNTARSRSRAAVLPASEEEAGCLQKALVSLGDQQLFRHRDLTLEKLAWSVGTTPHFLSKVVNERCGTTVPELVNRFRVEAAQRMLHDPAGGGRTIHEIADAVGFTSRSAFNAAFKKHTGTTPSRYRDRSCANS